MSKPTVEAATNDLIHVLGNFLGIVRHERKTSESGGPTFMTADHLGRWAMKKEPELSAALDALRGAMSVAKIEADDYTHHVWTNSHTGETVVLYEGGLSNLPARKYPWLLEFSGDFIETTLFCTGWRAGWLAREVSKK